MTKRYKEHFDVIVAGGGISGTMAAIAAASEGAKTLLIERYSALGGMATLGLVQPITTWGKNKQYVTAGRGKKLLEQMYSEDIASMTPMSHYGPCCDTEYLKSFLEKKVVESGAKLLYHSWISKVKKEHNVLTGVNIVSKAGTMIIPGDVFIDATGDADIAAMAGIPFAEGKQGITLMFVMAGINRKNCPSMSEIQRIWQKYKIGYRSLALFWHPREDAAYVNVTEIEGVSGLDPWALTDVTIQCRRQAWQVLDVVRKHIPGFENAYIEQTAPAIGVRESRRIQGCYTLTKDDVLKGVEFPDTIARAGCPIDIHGSINNGTGEYSHLKKSYGIPYRSMITNSVSNLIVTGRPVSADHVVHSSIRRMAPGFALGEAAGVAAAMTKKNMDVRSISVPMLQQILKSYGAILDVEEYKQ